MEFLTDNKGLKKKTTVDFLLSRKQAVLRISVSLLVNVAKT